MKLYKLRSIERLEWLADILTQERLYCPAYHELNDPFEGYCTIHGTFGSFGRRYYTPTTVDDLRAPEEATELRLCSLSASVTDIKLWSHYAGGHRGVAVELDFSGLEHLARRVNYTEGLLRYDEDKGEYPSLPELLTHKTKDWQYEDEWRILQEEPFFDVKGRIKRVLLGTRCKKTDEAIICALLPTGASIARVDLDPLTAKIGIKNE